MMKKKLIPLAGAALMLLPLAGCVVDEPAASSGDAEAGPVTVVCGSPEEACESVIAAFTESTGIQADYVRLSGGEILARLESTKGSSSTEFDAWYGGPADTFVAAADRDLLAAYESPERENLREGMMDEEGYWTGIYQNPMGICWSKSAFERLGVDEPDEWDDLLDPALKQNVTTAHPATSGMGFTFLATQMAVHDGDEDAAFEWLGRLHPNVLQYTKSGTAPTQMLVRGEVAAIPAFTSSCERERDFNGNDDIMLSYPKDGAGYEIGATAIVKGTDNEAGAQAFTDWALGAEAFDAQVAVGYRSFPTFEVEGGSEGDISDVTLVEDLDPATAGAQRVHLAERFDSEIAPAPVDE